MSDMNERIAVLEAEVKALKEDRQEMLEIMHSIKDEMTRYKGFLGGIAFLASGVMICLTLAKDWLLKHL